ncbi:hypothetical protein AU210_010084 [Fusarium oxysporum f. sp. radicis-cucumerinum]|uniref:Uncharacterized protein n=1 Tax=Fusarium oxysporum f. sp. radicis-cucumerinum TaxID=327505 RepID=A0A2H3H157_FUSOX|nr:hypothetical protein AU210_010084 [Fusarium oxysporum f. sp. radicis-cucumerinum]
MDPFNALPPEIRLKILFSIASKFSLSSVIRASPTMLQQYRQRRTQIRQNLIATDFDEEMVQDALAIIQFPSQRVQSAYKLHLVHSHLQRWLDKDFSSPLTNPDHSLLQSLDDLHSMLLSFIQDYCTKATASYTPREYLCLQRIQPPSPGAKLFFRDDPVSSCFNLDTLTKMELDRFFKAFLLYELNCKVTEALGTSPNPGNPRNNLPQRAIHTSEDEAIHCVHTYVRSLYGACIAQRGDGFLPSGPDRSSLEAGLVFPDSFCFDPDIYTRDAGLHGTYNGAATSHLAKLGLKTIAKLALYRFGSRLKDDSLFSQALDNLSTSGSYRMGPYKHVVTRIGAPDDAGSPMYDRLSARLSRSDTIQLQIYQQRAWVFFDNTRFYPPRNASRPCFPTQNFLSQEADRLVNHRGGLVESSELIRSRTRSQKWQDDYATEQTLRANADKIRELQQDNLTLRKDNDTLRQTIAESPELSVPAFEDPTVLREEARRLVEEQEACDLATVAKYARYVPLYACIVCRQPPQAIDLPADSKIFEDKTPAEIELVLSGYLWAKKEYGTLDPEEPIDFCFAFW